MTNDELIQLWRDTRTWLLVREPFFGFLVEEVVYRLRIKHFRMLLEQPRQRHSRHQEISE